MLKTEKLTKDWVNKRLPKRPKNANKGTFGKVLVVAGSQNYPGAAYLACAASYRVGVGLATLVTTSIVETIISRKLPEVTFLLPEQAFEKLFEYDVVLLGPGLGQDESTIKFVNKLLQIKLSKMVIDGDGLNILSQTDKWWKKFHTRVILTPHPGEMSRLTGRSIADIQSDRKNIAIKYAKQWRQIVVLKGANTIIVSHDGEIKIAPFVNPALATAGTGDVLSGVIAGFIAQGLDLFDAACCGVYIHGLAGEKLKEKVGQAGTLASEILPLLPKILRSFH